MGIPYYSKGLVALRFRPGQLESEDVNEQALEVLQAFRIFAYLPRERGLYPGSRRRALLMPHRCSIRRGAACSNRW